jgi:hypothetical protein
MAEKHMERIMCIWRNSGYAETDTVKMRCVLYKKL